MALERKQPRQRRPSATPGSHGVYRKPEPKVQTTTLWDFPSQQYGAGKQGDKEYTGATPAYIIWNLLQRYTQPGDLVVDPFCGSGTTLDVAAELDRRALGFDIAPYRDDIQFADARKLPVRNNQADFVFMDPPYSTHVEYSDDPRCIGKLDAGGPEYYEAMALAIKEAGRILKPKRYLALYCCDSFRKGKPFCPIGFELFTLLRKRLEPVDVVAVTRRNRTLMRRHYHTEAEKGNFFLRGFNYLFIMQSP